jgi:hypothetical protein
VLCFVLLCYSGTSAPRLHCCLTLNLKKTLEQTEYTKDWSDPDFSRDPLKVKFRKVNGALYEITPYLVGGGAFSLSRYMQKNFDVKNRAVRDDFLCVEFNRRLTNARRCLERERAFGRRRGRWSFLDRNLGGNSYFFSLQLERVVDYTTGWRKEDLGGRKGAMMRSRAQRLEITMGTGKLTVQVTRSVNS